MRVLQCHVDRSKLREEFLIYLDDATRFSPRRKTREFEVVNGDRILANGYCKKAGRVL